MNMQNGMTDPQALAFALSTILMLSMPFALVALIGIQIFRALAPDRFEEIKESIQTSPRLVPFGAAVLSVTAGVIHLELAPEHANQVAVWGLFFALVGMTQIACGLALLFWSNRSLYAATGYIDFLLAAIYVIVRIVPPPLSPTGEPEELEIVGIFTVLIEVALVIAVIYLMRFRGKFSETLQ
ncbi:MAG: hypothetical protein HY257_08700 [Chloroflexi bacterium]|nr:hypothetical protein [Chloroflexota bacterium]